MSSYHTWLGIFHICNSVSDKLALKRKHSKERFPNNAANFVPSTFAGGK